MEEFKCIQSDFIVGGSRVFRKEVNANNGPSRAAAIKKKSAASF